MKKTIILFDIDHTLLDTEKLRGFINGKVAQILCLKLQKIYRLNKKYSRGLTSGKEFSPRHYLDFLKKELSEPVPKNKLLNIFFKSPVFYQKSLYPETISVLKKIKKRYSLGIFSEGCLEFQETKLRLAGLENFLKTKLIFVYPDKSGKAKEIVKKHSGIWVVDDNPKHILNLSKIKGVFPVWVNRKQVKIDYFPPHVFPISSLDDLGVMLQ